jgi:DNA-binding NarL/FixJ family response regulator
MHKGVHFNDIMNAGLRHKEEGQSRESDLMKIWNSLSDKQRQFAEIATTHDGESHKQLAVRMNISLGTAKTHARAVHAALGIHSRLQLVRIVQQLRSETVGAGMG